MSNFLMRTDEFTNEKMIDSILKENKLCLYKSKIYGTKVNFNNFLELIGEQNPEVQGKFI